MARDRILGLIKEARVPEHRVDVGTLVVLRPLTVTVKSLILTARLTSRLATDALTGVV
jgi:hypothetical protein